ncbi:DUF2920 family protein [Campylobacter upsaliensis]|uniref:DUF2920 family protein n=1 Tax=Campylobacter upsaliensis TaxID=28080 RepID=UPI00126FC9DD|nr:DUF2920 family protein [Campylobacter upsaliensis]EAI3918229.1 DUF2920 family protein [Campylobacter upsaliensis]EAJ7110262.1 DUF2920 family protein [Campylobacter upsaliensis]EAK0464132.1 DUF2920 family protein [Campylobacter upsaliensis]
MLVDKSYHIKSCDDEELGIKRESKLEFRLCWEDSEPVRLLLVLNQGLGDDINNSFFKLIMQALAKKHNAAVIAANYHNIGNRPQIGAKIGMDDFDKNIVEQFCKVNGIHCILILKQVNLPLISIKSYRTLLKYLKKMVLLRRTLN